MGGIISSEDKAARAKAVRSTNRSIERTIGVPWDPHGYRYREQQVRISRSRKCELSQQEEVGKVDRRTRGRSQSLDAILEELYLSDTEGDGQTSFIPRVKLTANRGVDSKPLARRSLSQLEADVNSLHAIHMQVEQKNAFERSHLNLRSSVSLPFLDPSEWEEDMEAEHASLGPPSYSKEFDACMRQLEMLERNIQQQDMEVSTLPRQRSREETSACSEEQLRSLTMPRGRSIKRQMTPTNEPAILPPESSDQSDVDQPEVVSEMNDEAMKEETEEAIRPVLAKRQIDKIIIIEPEEPQEETEPVKRSIPRGWYCNLRDQFDRLDKELGGQEKRQDASCRITGATLKNNKGIVQAEDDRGSHRKLYFSQLVRSNKSLIDEELPDPDKVQNIRAMFQEQHARLGGSLQNISTNRREETKPERPKSALGSRKEDEYRCVTPDSVDGSRRLEDVSNQTVDSDRKTRRRWTDSGSMSSGVSSDLSCCETDQESCNRDVVEASSSGDELDVVDKHYIQNEILEKIRSYGTSVTYFGGQMIRCSVGPLVSPTTQAILEEIGQKHPNGNSCTRSFDEFYKKYKETTKKRKVGRTRSFAQEEMFQKPNVFNNTEIDEHKMELEAALGIRKPTGKQAAGIKSRLGKCYSLDSKLESIEKALSNQDSDEELRPNGEVYTQVNTVSLTTPSETQRYYSSGDYFQYNIHTNGKKPDMEFEEFEVCESIAEKLDKMNEKESINNLVLSDVQEITSTVEEEETVHNNEKADYENTNKKLKEDLRVETENSTQEKRNSWEVAILQKRISVESHFSERNDGAFIRSNNAHDSGVSYGSSYSEDMINSFGGEIKDISNTSNVNSCLKCSSESKQSTDFDSDKNTKHSQNTWRRQAQLRENNIDNTERRRNSSDSPNKNKDERYGTWKRFVENRKCSSTESLSMNRSSQEMNNRRSSVKKLIFLHNDIDFCQGFKPDANKPRSLNSGMSSLDYNKRSSVGRKLLGSQENSVGKNIDDVRKSLPRKALDENIEPRRGNNMNECNLPVEEGRREENENETRHQREHKITIKISQTENECYKIGSEKFEEIVINDQEPVDSLELYCQMTEEANNTTNVDDNILKKGVQQESSEYKRRFDRNRNYKSQSRWPMETTVVVDMERSEEASPKLISHGKSHVKTTKRHF